MYRNRIQLYVPPQIQEADLVHTKHENKNIIQIILSKSVQSLMCAAYFMWVRVQEDLGELILMVCVDTEARHWGTGEAGAVRQFSHSTDVTHRFVFQGRGWDFHLVLLVYRSVDKHTQNVTVLLLLFGRGHECVCGLESYCGPAHPWKCWRCIQTPGYPSGSSLTGETALCSASS